MSTPWLYDDAALANPPSIKVSITGHPLPRQHPHHPRFPSSRRHIRAIPHDTPFPFPAYFKATHPPASHPTPSSLCLCLPIPGLQAGRGPAITLEEERR